jgi:hypothetical protein
MSKKQHRRGLPQKVSLIQFWRLVMNLSCNDKKEIINKARKILKKDGISLIAYRNYLKSSEFSDKCKSMLNMYGLKKIECEMKEIKVYINIDNSLHCVHTHKINK